MSDDTNPIVGTNTLTLNAATMTKAIEYWLNECVFMCDAGVEIVSVAAGDCSTTATFKVTFRPPEAKKK
jgi:hypothetical protein